MRNALAAQSVKVSEPFGLPTGSLTVMSLIAKNPDCSQADLVQYAGITGPSLVGIIDELERRGLVQRVRSDEDRRRNMLKVTETGEQTMMSLFDEVSLIEGPIQAELDPEELARLIRLLDRAIAALGIAER